MESHSLLAKMTWRIRKVYYYHGGVRGMRLKKALRSKGREERSCGKAHRGGDNINYGEGDRGGHIEPAEEEKMMDKGYR